MDDTQIGNLTLSRIGISLKIASLDDRSKEAIELRNVFSLVRERVLEAAPWPFARKIVPLQKVGAQPYGFLYRYVYPNDCLAIRALLPPATAGQSAEAFRQWVKTNPVRHEIQLDSDNRTICTDQDLAFLEYTVRVTNPRLFSAKFVSAFAWALAMEVALPLAKTIDYSRNAGAQYEKELNEAIAAGLNEEKQDAPPDSEFVRARL